MIGRIVRKIGELFRGELTERKVGPEVHLHVGRAYPSAGLTPWGLAQVLRLADAGDVRLQYELFSEMEEKDTQIESLIQSRRLAVLSLAWEVQSGGEGAAAREAAKLVREVLETLSFEDVLADMLDAVGKGVSVQEMVWRFDGRWLVPEEFHYVEPRFLFLADEAGRPLERPRVATEEAPVWGVPAQRGKFVCFVHKARSGLPSRCALFRPVAYMYVLKKYALQDWAIYTERFATPMRLGKYSPGATEADIETLWEAVRSLATDAAAVISENTSVELLELANRGDVRAFKELVEYCDRQMAKAILGQTLTSDTSPHGTLATAKVHAEVREDLLRADVRALSAAVRREIFEPLVRFNLGENAPVPKLAFNLEDEEDQEKTAKIYSILVKDVGLAVPRKHLYEKFNIPEPEQGEAVVGVGLKGEGLQEEGERIKAEGECLVLSAGGDWVEKYLSVVREMAPELREQALSEIEEWLRGLDRPPGLEELQSRVQQALTSHYAQLAQAQIPVAQMMISFAKEAAQELGISAAFNLVDQQTLEYAQQTQALLTSSFIQNEDARKLLQKTIEDFYLEYGLGLFGRDKEKAIALLRERLGETLSEIEDWQLRRIAETEVVRLKNLARLDAFHRVGVKKLVVNEIMDARTCARCRAMHGRILKVAEAKAGADYRWELPPDKQYALNPAPEDFRKNLRGLVLSGYGIPPYHPHCRGRVIAYYEPKKDSYPLAEKPGNTAQKRAADWWESIHPDFRKDLVKTVQEKAEWRGKLLKQHARRHPEVSSSVEDYFQTCQKVLKNPDKVFIKVDEKGKAEMIFGKGKERNWQMVIVDIDGRSGNSPTITTCFGPMGTKYNVPFEARINEGQRSQGWVEIKMK